MNSATNYSRRLGEHYPSERHHLAARKATDFLRVQSGVDAILLVNSCARGVATTDSCLDIGVLVDPGVHRDNGKCLEVEWEKYYRGNESFREFENVGRFSEIHLYTFTGEFAETERDTTSGPDSFEVEIGNAIGYSVPLYEATRRFQELRKNWLPFYNDTLRQERLEKATAYFGETMAHVAPFVSRGLYFQAFKRLHIGFEEFLQCLFISRRVYPLCYDKWIREQLEELLGLPELFPRMAALFQISRFCSGEIIGKSKDLSSIFDEYIIP